MKLVFVALAAATLASGAASAATDQSKFEGTLRKSGIDSSSLTSRKVCVCNGGSLDGYVGVIVTFFNSGYFTYDCSLPSFNINGANDGGASCVNNGGTAVMVPR